MSGLVFLLLCASVAGALVSLTFRPKKHKRQDFEHWRIEQTKQNALDDIQRRRERAEDQLRRLSRWYR